MKYLFISLSFISFIFSQGECDGSRYQEEIFSNVNVTSGIYYGTNMNQGIFGNAVEEDLYLDVYEPAGDTLEDRPLIILLFGGSFIGGSRTSSNMVSLCTAYAKMGYVAAAIDYRLTTELIFLANETTAYIAATKAIHDLKGAIRFFRMNDELYNDYKIDESRIYAGGVSAGAIGAVNAAYLNEDSEIPSMIQDFIDDSGGLEGISGNSGYDSSFHGIINLCGGVGQTEWIIEGDIPVVSVHGTEDDIVPYGDGLITLFGLNMEIAGSAAIHDRMIALGNPSELLTWEGIGHTPFTSSSSYMNETIEFTAPFIHDLACTTDDGLLGDINSDTTLNVLDIILLVNIILENNPSNQEMQLGDINYDGTLNILDVINLVNLILDQG